MAVSQELVDFTRDALARGIPRAEIERTLRQAGWDADTVRSTLAGFADIEFPVPVPAPKPSVSARDTFLYLLLFGMLYVAAFNAGAIVFHAINRLLPDEGLAAGMIYAQQALRWSVASLIVSLPVFLLLSRIVERELRAEPAKARSAVRRWLTYLTVFVASSIAIGDFITLVYNLLGGELTLRFILKAGTIAVIAGGALLYYLSDLRRLDAAAAAPARPTKRTAAIASSVAAVVLVVAGIVMAGSPQVVRDRRWDTVRVRHLSGIARSAETFYTRHGRLPASLDELAREGGASIAVADPAGVAYEYRIVDDGHFEVCATFDRDSGEGADGTGAGFWSHGPGRTCFQLDAERQPEHR